MQKIKTIDELKQKLKKIKNGNALTKKYAETAVQNLNLVIETKDDLFLYCASLNYLNAYVKKGEGKKREVHKLLKKQFSKIYFQNGYGFKKFVNVAISAILDNDFENVTFRRFPQDKNLIIITIDGLQFSYHGILLYDRVLRDVIEEERKSINNQSRKIDNKKWEGLMLQPVAQEVLVFAENLEGLTNKVFDGKGKANPDDNENE